MQVEVPMTDTVSNNTPSHSADPADPRRVRVKGSRTFALAGVLLPLVLAILWEGAIRGGFAVGRLMPPPSTIGATLWELAKSGELQLHCLATLGRVLAGFALGALFGTMVGAAAGSLVVVSRLIDPTLQALRAVPSIAWVPLFILWMGIFETSKVALIAVGVFFPVYLGVAGAIIAIDRKLIEVGRVFRLTRWAMCRTCSMRATASRRETRIPISRYRSTSPLAPECLPTTRCRLRPTSAGSKPS